MHYKTRIDLMSEGKIDPKVIVTSISLALHGRHVNFETGRKPTQIKVTIKMDEGWKWKEKNHWNTCKDA